MYLEKKFHLSFPSVMKKYSNCLKVVCSKRMYGHKIKEKIDIWNVIKKDVSFIINEKKSIGKSTSDSNWELNGPLENASKVFIPG